MRNELNKEIRKRRKIKWRKEDIKKFKKDKGKFEFNGILTSVGYLMPEGLYWFCLLCIF